MRELRPTVGGLVVLTLILRFGAYISAYHSIMGLRVSVESDVQKSKQATHSLRDPYNISQVEVKDWKHFPRDSRQLCHGSLKLIFPRFRALHDANDSF